MFGLAIRLDKLRCKIEISEEKIEIKKGYNFSIRPNMTSN